MKKIVAGLLVSLAFAAGQPALAQSAAAPGAALSADQAAAVNELLEVMNYRAVMAASLQQMGYALPAMMRENVEQAIRHNPNLDEAGRKAALARMEQELPQMVAAMQQVVASPGLMDDIIAATTPIYTRYYTADEMRQIAAFYRTPVGKKTLQVMPQLMGEAMEMGQRVIAPHVQKIMQSMKK
ncbi:DUF2059 domain-containing protein [Massilia sp. NR 4-1]|uniref:DUF2059 domain-containing protein n=1 Tax=Massilia sp. NR 4-1 TaxID=1678028 RepID=UPI00067CBCA8|nr:DUF2059 domain-containing protein [Massilia sp. NR 4-1]AKU22094.1 hypothetical protein ACZ75_12100 [Massilia sp. NR 4-1]